MSIIKKIKNMITKKTSYKEEGGISSTKSCPRCKKSMIIFGISERQRWKYQCLVCGYITEDNIKHR
jgi:transposase-like protein